MDKENVFEDNVEMDKKRTDTFSEEQIKDMNENKLMVVLAYIGILFLIPL